MAQKNQSVLGLNSYYKSLIFTQLQQSNPLPSGLWGSVSGFELENKLAQALRLCTFHYFLYAPLHRFKPDHDKLSSAQSASLCYLMQTAPHWVEGIGISRDLMQVCSLEDAQSLVLNMPSLDSLWTSSYAYRHLKNVAQHLGQQCHLPRQITGSGILVSASAGNDMLVYTQEQLGVYLNKLLDQWSGQPSLDGDIADYCQWLAHLHINWHLSLHPKSSVPSQQVSSRLRGIETHGTWLNVDWREWHSLYFYLTHLDFEALSLCALRILNKLQSPWVAMFCDYLAYLFEPKAHMPIDLSDLGLRMRIYMLDEAQILNRMNNDAGNKTGLAGWLSEFLKTPLPSLNASPALSAWQQVCLWYTANNDLNEDPSNQWL